MYESIAVPMLWLLFLALWLIYYAYSFSVLQNAAVILFSFIVAGVLELLVWPTKHADKNT